MHTYRVSNLKYESVRIDSKTVVFIRANPGKKETTDRSASHAFFFRDWCTFPAGSAKFQKMARDQKIKFAVTGKITKTIDHCERDYYNMTVRVYIRSVRVSFWGDN